MENEIEIVFEDESLMVVNKPAGWVVTSEGVRKGECLEDWLRKERMIELPRAGIVHRIDKGTSGLVLVAKNKKVLEELMNQFKNRLVKKKYWILAEGEVVEGGEINMPIKRSVFSKFGVAPMGKTAITSFKLVRRYKIEGKRYSFLEVSPKTGRTHQIRVHLSYLGWPLVGDKTYGGKSLLGLGRPFLHAYSLEFWHPTKKKRVSCTVKLAEDLENILEKDENN
jgi:23S rRNA pseudouridine1911/1915/1917 synthase